MTGLKTRLSGSKLFRSVGIYTIANAINSAIPLLLLPVLTRYLTPQDYGLVSMFTIVTAVIAAVIGLGTHGAISREYFNREQKDFAEFVGTCILVVGAGAASLFLVTIQCGSWLAGATSIPENWVKVPMLMGLGQLLATIGLVIWQVRGLPLIYGAFQIGMSLVGAALSLLLIVGFGMGWEGRVIGQVVAVSVTATIIVGLLARQRWIVLTFRREHARRALRYGLPLVFHSLGAVAVATADKAIVTKLVSLTETGLYAVAGQVTMAITFLVDSFNRAYAPWLFERLKVADPRVLRRIVIGTYGYFIVILLLAGALAAVGPFLLGLVVGPKFAGASQYIFWLALASAFSGMYYMVTLYIQFSGKTEQLAAVTFTVGILDILLCSLLVRAEGGIGAAKATAIAQLVSFLATWWLAGRLIPMNWFFWRQTRA